MTREKQGTILVVDDEAANLGVLFEELRRAEFKVLIAEEGTSALQCIEKKQPDIILLDVKLPDIDGFELCRRLKKRPELTEVPVLFLTARWDPADKLTGFMVGGVDYITKPLHAEEVLMRVQTHLKIRRLQQQLQAQNQLLQEQNIRFQTLEDATFEGIVIHDGERIIEVNRRIEEMFGYSRAETLDKPPLHFVAPAAREIALAHIPSGDTFPYQIEGLRKDGTSIPLEIQTRFMQYQGRTLQVAAMRDLTWRKSLEEKTLQLEKENLALKTTMQDRYRFGLFVGKSQAMQEVYEQIANAAASDFSVLISGESGTGKELTAFFTTYRHFFFSILQYRPGHSAPFLLLVCGLSMRKTSTRRAFSDWSLLLAQELLY